MNRFSNFFNPLVPSSAGKINIYRAIRTISLWLARMQWGKQPLKINKFPISTFTLVGSKSEMLGVNLFLSLDFFQTIIIS